MSFRIKKDPVGLFCKSMYYSGLADPVGQTSAQAPQSMQSSAEITYISPSEIASDGHSPMQAPQAMHSSSIMYAIYFTPFKCLRHYFNRLLNKFKGYI